jgi:hypothetical protein
MKNIGQYPKPISMTSGCRVGWLTYKTAADAAEAAIIAQNEAEALEREGYDFGFSIPGAISLNDDGTFSVVIP